MPRRRQPFDINTPSRPTPEEKREALLRTAVRAIMETHGLSERDAASIVITITSVVRLAAKDS